MAGEGAGSVRNPKSAVWREAEDVRRCCSPLPSPPFDDLRFSDDLVLLPEDRRVPELLRFPDPPRLPPDDCFPTRRNLSPLVKGPLLLMLPVLCSLLVRSRLPELVRPTPPDPRRMERLRETPVERAESFELARSLLLLVAVRNAPETGSVLVRLVALAFLVLVGFVTPPELPLSRLALLLDRREDRSTRPLLLLPRLCSEPVERSMTPPAPRPRTLLLK